MANKLLTIIVPTYNMEAYLDKCLTSLIVGKPGSNLMQMLEVLVINDGSTDSSSAIAHGYEERYPETFKLVDKENGNYGSCINTALPIATGKYIKILDADDSFDNAVFVEYLAFLQNVDVDMVYSNYRTVDMQGNGGISNGICVPPLKELDFTNSPSIYNKVCMHCIAYKSSIFDGLNYHQTEGISYTDCEWVFLPMSCVKTFLYYPYVLYQYLSGRFGQTTDPIVRYKNYKMAFIGIEVFIDIYQSCLQNGGKWNALSVNIEYLRVRCISRIENSYFNMLSRHKDAVYVSRLHELDDVIRTRYPEFYKELDNVIHPNPHISQFRLPFRFIRCWHEHGIKAATLQVWIINHILGMSARMVKFLAAFKGQ